MQWLTQLDDTLAFFLCKQLMCEAKWHFLSLWPKRMNLVVITLKSIQNANRTLLTNKKCTRCTRIFFFDVS